VDGLRGQIILFALILAASLPALAVSAAQSTETQIFYPQPGDTAVIQNDFGRIRINTWNRPTAEVKIRKIAADQDRLLNIDVVSQRTQGKIFIHVYYFEYQSESVFLDLQVPDYLNVMIWGANPAVEITGLSGFVRATTLTGFITAEDLKSSASLASDEGNIIYRSTIQPSGDIRLESLKGNISCRIAEGLNLRGWFRAGGKLAWNGELEMKQGSLEKQVGIGGPLLLASSLAGNVTFVVDAAIRPQAGVAVRAPKPMPPAPDPAGPPVSGRNRPSPAVYDPVPARSASQPPRLEPDDPAGGPDSDAETRGEAPATMPVAYPADNSPAGTGGYTLKVNVDLVWLNASVRDRYTNRTVPNLRKEDFRIYENGDLQAIDRFAPNEAPFNLLLLLDVSGSTKSYMKLIKNASVEFTRQIRNDDRIALATFNSRTRLNFDFTNDRRRIEKEIQRIKSGGGTAFYDALDRCVRRYMRDIEGRKAIVVFTDGVDNRLTGDFDNGSEITFRDLYRGIQEADTLIYTIFLDTEDEHGRPTSRSRNKGSLGGILADIILGKGELPGGSGPWDSGDPAYAEARRELELIAEQTGGRMYAPTDIRDLSTVYREIADDLRIQYTLGYHSTHSSHDGQWREIEVQVVNRPDLAVRARKGYYCDHTGP